MKNNDDSDRAAVKDLLERFKEYPVCITTATDIMLADFEASENDPIRSETDMVLEALCDLYKACSCETRLLVREHMKGLGSCVHFASRAAVRALRGGTKQEITRGLTALVIEDVCFDFRETLVALAMLQHAAIKIVVDYEREYQHACLCASPATSVFLQKCFLNVSVCRADLIESHHKHGPTVKRRPWV